MIWKLDQLDLLGIKGYSLYWWCIN